MPKTEPDAPIRNARQPPDQEHPGQDWRPTADWDHLRRRAEVLARVRRFFARRGVVEVETPLLSAAAVTDPQLHSLRCRHPLSGRREPALYLQTSPEFAMKRLLASGSGAIFQICKAFRGGELGRLHHPEFTLLEWYRPGFDHHALMAEVEALLSEILDQPAAERIAYGELFERHLGLDPHTASEDRLARAAAHHGIDVVGLGADLGNASARRDGWLHLLMSHLIEPRLGVGRPTFVFDYPASQAALARLRPGPPGKPAVAERFEVYVAGVELANGFHELDDADEQRRRFEHDLADRHAAGASQPPVDERLLAALAHGLGDCAGVALGVDRLVMLALGATHLDEVVAFPLDRA